MKPDTIAVIAGRDPIAHGGTVSPPVERASTRIFPDRASVTSAHGSNRLSAFLGSRTPDFAADAVAALEGSGAEALITSSGMSALTIAFLTVLRSGDHLLLPDSVFGPTRDVAKDLLRRLEIQSSYYHPLADAAEFRASLRPNTRLVLTESPGSNTFEVQDIPMIVEIAHEAGALVAIDNSWATPILFPPLAHGVDMSISAATKYLGGHSDVILGTIACSPDLMVRVRETARLLGDLPGADDAWLLARGLRTLPLRMRQHEASTLRIVEETKSNPIVRRVLHPAMQDAPGHSNWKRDFSGSSGLFSLLLDPLEETELDAFLGALKLFRLGFSWGGFESLILPVAPDLTRKMLAWPEGTLLRLSVGLEDPDDLLADLAAGFRAIDRGN